MPSNFATIPIAASGKTCSDAASPVTPQQYQAVQSQSSAKVGALALVQSFAAGGGSAAVATFQQIGGYGGTVGNGLVSVGSCIVTNSLQSPSTTIAGLDAGGAITLSGPAGATTLIPISAQGVPQGTYGALLSAGFIPAGGGAFTFDNAAGGADVGHFTAPLNFPGSFAWTNQAQVTSTTSSLGLTVTWTGGAGGGLAAISGLVGATLAGNSSASASFTCYAPLAAGTFTVPPAVLQSLPSGNGTLSVGVLSNPSGFTAPGLDVGEAVGAIVYTQGVAYGGSVRQ